MIDFLVENPLFTIALCLGLGYLFGKINLGFFPNNATLGTLYAAIIINILISSNGGTFQAEQVKIMKTLFFALFTFILGYDAGPLFRNSIRTSGMKASIKLVILSIFYCLCVLGCAYLICSVFHFSPGRSSGFLAGSQTQSTILNGESDVVAYAITYILGTLGLIIFVQKIAPKLLKTDLITAAKEKVDNGNNEKLGGISFYMPIQIRSYRIDEDSPYAGKTIDDLEADYNGRLQIAGLYRNAVELDVVQSQVVQASDVMLVVGNIHDIDKFDDKGLTETTEEDYISYEMSHVDFVISKSRIPNILDVLSNKGILVTNLRRKGKDLELSPDIAAEKGDIISLTGRTDIIKKFMKEFGYAKTEGDISDIPLILLSIAIAIPFGLIRFPGTSLTLGTSCCALIIGMLVGCENDSQPKVGYVATGAKWLLKSIGLNLFIAATALERPLFPGELFTFQNIFVVVAGVISVVAPAVLAILFGKTVLKLASADILGGLCGCATSTPALNSLSEATGSTIFSVGYTPAYVTSNICLTLTGSLLMALIG